MAEEAVCCEPVSHPRNSLILGPIQGISSISSLIATPCAQIPRRFKRLLENSLGNRTGKFPKQNREYTNRNSENLLRAWESRLRSRSSCFPASVCGPSLGKATLNGAKAPCSPSVRFRSPLVIVEQFGTLDSVYPGRIDLSVGRAPGTDPKRGTHGAAGWLRVRFAPGTPHEARDGCNREYRRTPQVNCRLTRLVIVLEVVQVVSLSF